MSAAYQFADPLVEGVILRRPNRFLMEVLIQGKQELCHCPCTGRISNLNFEQIPCLVSVAAVQSQRKTNYTVEAISLNDPDAVTKHWIGINQNKANRYIEYFLQTHQLNRIIDCQHPILREQVLGDSKLDFLVDNNYLEVKTPLMILPLPDDFVTNRHLKAKPESRFTAYDRFVKHLHQLSASLQDHQQAFLLLFYMFDALPFIPPVSNADNPVMTTVLEARKHGVEMWQINAHFSATEVRLTDYYPCIFGC